MLNKSKTIILIGGAPTSGKSTIAREVSEHLKLPWISTDQIRDIMRAVVKKADIPNLFNPEGYSAERFYTEFSPEELVKMEFRQGEAAWVGVKKLIDDDYTWENGFTIEGVGLLPYLISRDYKTNQNIKPVFLADDNVDNVRKVIYTRGLWADADTYSNDIKEKEVEWVLLFGNKLKEEANKFDLTTKSSSSVSSIFFNFKDLF